MYNRAGPPKFTPRSTNPRGHQQMHQQRQPSDRLDMRDNPMNGRMRNEPNYSTGMPPHVQSSHQYHAADMSVQQQRQSYHNNIRGSYNTRPMNNPMPPPVPSTPESQPPVEDEIRKYVYDEWSKVKAELENPNNPSYECYHEKIPNPKMNGESSGFVFNFEQNVQGEMILEFADALDFAVVNIQGRFEPFDLDQWQLKRQTAGHRHS